MASRGRPKGSKNKPKLEAVSPAAGHNSGVLTDDQIHHLTRQHKGHYEKALAAKKQADAAFKNTCKLARAELGPHAVDDIKQMIQLDSPEGEAALRAELERKVRIARWMGMPVGVQGSIFDEDRRPIGERAFDEGKRAGMEGKTCKSPFDGEAGQAWIAGWHEGQAINAAGIKPTAGLLRPVPDEPTGSAAVWPDDEQIEQRAPPDFLSPAPQEPPTAEA